MTQFLNAHKESFPLAKTAIWQFTGKTFKRRAILKMANSSYAGIQCCQKVPKMLKIGAKYYVQFQFCHESFGSINQDWP